MNNSRLWKFAALAVGGLYLAACVPDPTGAPCADDSNCPGNQHCDLGSKKCVAGAPGTGGGAGGAGGGSGGAGGGSGGGGGAGGGGGGSGCLNSSGNPADLQTDPLNCGTCGTVCATPVNASASCVAGNCGRGACTPPFFDVDGPATFGCESQCTGRTCSLPDGGSVTLSNDPIAETRMSGRSVVNGTSLKDVMSNASYMNMGSIGEATPGPDGGIETSNSTHKHRGGFGARVK